MGKYANGDGSIYKWMKDGKVIRDEGAVTYTGDDGKTKRHTVYGPPARRSATSSAGP